MCTLLRSRVRLTRFGRSRLRKYPRKCDKSFGQGGRAVPIADRRNARMLWTLCSAPTPSARRRAGYDPSEITPFSGIAAIRGPLIAPDASPLNFPP